MPTNPLTNTVKRKLIALGIHGTMRPVHYALRHSYPDGKALDRATRRQDLLNLLKMFGAIQTTDLETIFGFSDYTIREMARELAGDGLIVIRSDYPAPRDGRRGGRAPKWLQVGYDTLSAERLDQLRQAAQILLEYQPVRRAELERERAERQARIDAWRLPAQALERPAQEIPPAPAQDRTLLHAQDHAPRHAQDRTPLYAQEPDQERVEGPEQNPALDMVLPTLQEENTCSSTCDLPAPALAESHAQEQLLDMPPARPEPCPGPPNIETRTLPPVVAAQVQEHQELRTRNQEPRTENQEHDTILPRQPRPVVVVRSGQATPYAQRPLLPVARIEAPLRLRDRWYWLDVLLSIGEDLRYGVFEFLDVLDLGYHFGRAARAVRRAYRRIVNNPEPTVIWLMVVATIWVIVWASQWSLGWQLPSWMPGARTPPGAQASYVQLTGY